MDCYEGNGSLMSVVNLDDVRAAQAIAEEFNTKLGSEIKRADKAGCKLVYRLEIEDQIGRGELNVALIRLLPVTNRARLRMKKHGAEAIQARADFLEPEDTFDALRAAVDEAFKLAGDAGLL